MFQPWEWKKKVAVAGVVMVIIGIALIVAALAMRDYAGICALVRLGCILLPVEIAGFLKKEYGGIFILAGVTGGLLGEIFGWFVGDLIGAFICGLMGVMIGGTVGFFAEEEASNESYLSLATFRGVTFGEIGCGIGLYVGGYLGGGLGALLGAVFGGFVGVGIGWLSGGLEDLEDYEYGYHSKESIGAGTGLCFGGAAGVCIGWFVGGQVGAGIGACIGVLGGAAVGWYIGYESKAGIGAFVGAIIGAGIGWVLAETSGVIIGIWIGIVIGLCIGMFDTVGPGWSLGWLGGGLVGATVGWFVRAFMGAGIGVVIGAFVGGSIGWMVESISSKRREKIDMEKEIKEKERMLRIAEEFEKIGEFVDAKEIYQELGEEEKAKKMEKLEEILKEARECERAGNYRKAAVLYDYLRMEEDAKRCRKRISVEVPIAEFMGYQVIEKVKGHPGGFADIYRVKKDGQYYALKVPPEADLSEKRKTIHLREEEVEEFKREGEVWKKISNLPGVVKLIESGLAPFPWFIMEYMDGGTLRDRIKPGGMEVKEALRYAREILDIISRVHERKIVHRDIKPENILFNSQGEIKLTDFGLSRIVGSSTHLSPGGTYKGTLDYSAPEQFDARYIPDPRTDIYQIGAVMYEMLTGRPPFTGTLPEIYSCIMNKNPEPPSKLNPSVPPQLDYVVLKALAKKKEERWQSAEEFKKALAEVYNITPV